MFKKILFLLTILMSIGHHTASLAESTVVPNKQYPLRPNNIEFSRYYKVDIADDKILMMKKSTGQVDIFTKDGWLFKSLYDSVGPCRDPNEPEWNHLYMDLMADNEGVYVAKYCNIYDRGISKLYYNGRVEKIYDSRDSPDDWGSIHQLAKVSGDIYLLQHSLAEDIVLLNVSKNKEYKIESGSSNSNWISTCYTDDQLFIVTSENQNPSNVSIHTLDASGTQERVNINVNSLSHTLRFCTITDDGLHLFDAVGNVYKYSTTTEQVTYLGAIEGGFSGQSHLQTDISKDEETGHIYQLKQGLTVFDLDSGFVQQHTVRGNGPLQFDRVMSFSADEDGNLYILDISGSFQKVSPNGSILAYTQLDPRPESINLFTKNGNQYLRLSYESVNQVYDTEELKPLYNIPDDNATSSVVSGNDEYKVIAGRLYKNNIDISQPSYTSPSFQNCSSDSEPSEFVDGKLLACNDSLYQYVTANNNGDVFAARTHVVYRKRGGEWETFDIGQMVFDSGYRDLGLFITHGIIPDNEGNFLSIFSPSGSPTYTQLYLANLYKFDLDERKVFEVDNFSMPLLSNDIQLANGFVFISTLTEIFAYKQIDRPNTSKAIILTGGNELGNTLWHEAQANANHAFWALANQGYTKANIHYLNHNISVDTDQNGEPDDVDGIPSLANVRNALLDWATQAVDGEPVEDVVLYMIGHGGDGTFQLGNGEVLTDTQLAQWLDELQTTIQVKITVIYDGCQSGSFQQKLSNGSSERTIITSSRANQNAYFQDAISFSHLFWNQVLSGKTLNEAFQTTATSIDLAFDQNPLIDSDGDGVTNTSGDYDTVSQRTIGNGTFYSGSSPEIGLVNLTPVEQGESTSTVTVSEITDDQNVLRAWGIVTPPYTNRTQLGAPVLNLPRLELLKLQDGSYEGTFNGFEQPGRYYVAIYAQDNEGNTSIPEVVSFDVMNPLGRKALLVGGVNAKGQSSEEIQKQTDHAYAALIGQGYADASDQNCSVGTEDVEGDNVCYLSSSSVGTSGIDQATSYSGLKHILEYWAQSATSDLVVYLVGDVMNNALQLSESESVPLTDLRQWIDQVQETIEGTVTVIHEGSGSGASVSALGIVPEGTKRIVISSSAIGEGSYFPLGGDGSFSRYFWGKIAQGGNLDDAFSAGRASLLKFQTPQINVNGNSVSNEKVDRYLAKYHDLGLGIVLAVDGPEIDEIAMNTELSNSTSSELWVRPIVGLSTISKAWAVIEPSEYDPVTKQTGELSEIILEEDEQGRWRKTHSSFEKSGVYTVHYYIQDSNLRISSPRTSYLTKTQGSDAYEPDNTATTASYLSAITQYRQWHNFSDSSDEDFISFDADPARGIYTIKVDSTGSEADAAFRLFDADSNPISFGIAGSASEYVIDDLPNDSVELAYWTPTAAGRYLLRITNANLTSVTATINDGYTISIFPTDAPQDTSISGTITNADGAPVIGATVYTDENQQATTNNTGGYALKASFGDRSITVSASGYTDATQQLNVAEGEIPTLDMTLSLPFTEQNLKPQVTNLTSSIPTIQGLKLATNQYPSNHINPIVVQALQMNVPEEGATLHHLTINSHGSSNEATKVNAVKLYHDTNQNQQVDSGDIPIGSTYTFTVDNGSIELTLPEPYSLSQGQQQVLVAYEVQ